MDFSFASPMPSPIDAARRAAALNPHDPRVHFNLANLLYQAGRFGEAADAFGAAAALAPDDPMLRANRGIALAKAGRADEAVPILEAASKEAPDHPELFYNLGNAYRLRLRLDDAAQAYRRATDLRPDYALAHWNLALVLLLAGHLPEAWDGFEWRHWLPSMKPLPLRGPAWTGHLDRLADKTLLLMAEQGFGDTVQFARYVPVVASAGARVVLVCQAELKTLLARLPGVAHVAAPQETVVRYDLRAALMEVPRLVQTDLGSIPPAPYLQADDTKRAAWRDRLAALPARRKVGLVWAGRPTHENDANRSMRLADFAPLAGLEQIAWVSLQKGPAGEQVKTAPAGLVVHDWTRDLNDFADTAALVAELDLVIAVDTAVCHLAGALGRPVWTLLPTVPDWRWLVDRSDSPWYPSMRLFRQPTPGDWESVMHEVRSGLAR